jgi:hypothetical protein
MGAVVDDDCCEGESAEVGQGVFVVAGGDAAPVLDAVESAFDIVAVPVDVLVEAWGPATWASPEIVKVFVMPLPVGQR